VPQSLHCPLRRPWSHFALLRGSFFFAARRHRFGTDRKTAGRRAAARIGGGPRAACSAGPPGAFLFTPPATPPGSCQAPSDCHDGFGHGKASEGANQAERGVGLRLGMSDRSRGSGPAGYDCEERGAGGRERAGGRRLRSPSAGCWLWPGGVYGTLLARVVQLGGSGLAVT
jgi:hypothetical protein